MSLQTLKPEWAAFLAGIENFPNVRWAAKTAGISHSAHYRKLKAEPEYAALFSESWEIGVGRIRDIAIKRAVLGFDEPVIYKGEYQWYDVLDPKTGTTQRRLVTVRKFPERLLMKVLSAEIPEAYNRNRMEHTGPDGGPLQGKIEVVFIPAKKE